MGEDVDNGAAFEANKEPENDDLAATRRFSSASNSLR
jgi:hypothetical protein